MKITQLNFGYGDKPILSDVSLELRCGLTALVGPNGSGKTTLLRLMSGYLKANSGSIYIGNREISSFQPRGLAKKIAVMSQEEEIPFSLTVMEYVLMGRLPYESSYFNAVESRQKALDALSQVGVLDWQERVVQSLSGGEKQRVMLARALVQDPEILLLDEPVSHLDWSWQKKSLELIRELSKKRIIVSVIHDPNLVSFYFDSVIFLKKGQIVDQGVVGKILNQHILKTVFDIDFAVYSNAEGHSLFIPHCVQV